jgi:hypothetical protein
MWISKSNGDHIATGRDRTTKLNTAWCVIETSSNIETPAIIQPPYSMAIVAQVTALAGII